MKLSIILLTWNSERYIENCIGSIYNSIRTNDFEVILIDNGSKDKTLEVIRRNYPKVNVIENSYNKGMSVARNQGIRKAIGDYILILDIDTQIQPYSIDVLLEYMDSKSDCGVCGAKLIFPDGTLQKSCRRFPLVHAKIMRRINSFWAKEYLKSEQYIDKMENEKAFPVDYVIGACQMIRREAILETGPLDEKIFYGPEDVDFCLRMWLKGWKVCYNPKAVVIHYEQRITAKKFFTKAMYKHITGLIYYFIKHRYCFSRRRLYKRIGVR